MSKIVLASLLCAVLAAALDAGEHAPLGLVLVVPAGDLGSGLSRSEILRVADEALREKTNLYALPQEADVVAQRCSQGTFRCFVGLVAAAEQKTKMLAVISVAVGEDRTRARAAVVLIDIGRAMSCATGPAEEHEDCIVRNAIAAKTNAPAIATDRVAQLIADFFRDGAKAALSERGHWEPYGAIELTYARGGMELELDGKMIGATSPNVTMIERVLPGARKLRVSGSEEVAVVVTRGSTEKVAVVPRDDVFRGTMLWVGLSAIAAGAAITTYAAVRAANVDHVILCPDDCAPRFIGSSDGGGLLFAPLGLGLAGAGSAWTLGGVLDDPDRSPYIELVAGVLIFGATYTLGAVLGGGAP